MKTKDYTPLAMWSVLFIGIVGLAWIRLNRAMDLWRNWPINLDAVVVGLYLFWMLLELRISKKDLHTEGKKTSDAATCQLYGAGQALIILSALWFPSAWQTPHVAQGIGPLLFLLGGAYRIWAIHALGQFYSHRVRITLDHKIVTSGPYRLTRHPAYAGMIVANIGLTLYFFNWVTLALLVLVLIPAILLRIIIEEKTLFKIEGYAGFAKKRKRLFPAIW